MEHDHIRDEIQADLYEGEIRAANEANIRVTDPYLWQQLQEANIANPESSSGKKVTYL